MSPIDAIFGMAKAETEHLVRYRKWLVATGNFAVPLAIAIVCTLYAEIIQVREWLFWSLVLTLGGVQVILAFANFQTPQLVQEAYFHARPLEEENQACRRQIANLEAEIRYLNVLQDVLRAWNIMQRAYLQQDGAGAEHIREEIDTILRPVVRQREALFSFAPGELWNFAVYLYHGESRQLRPVWRDKQRDHPSQGVGRNWPPGQGHVGKAFADGKTLITGDATHPEIVEWIAAPPGYAKQHDATAYRSFASIPIERVGEEGAWAGVLVATSDRAGRFDSANSLVLRHAAVVLANLIASHNGLDRLFHSG